MVDVTLDTLNTKESASLFASVPLVLGPSIPLIAEKSKRSIYLYEEYICR